MNQEATDSNDRPLEPFRMAPTASSPVRTAHGLVRWVGRFELYEVVRQPGALSEPFWAKPAGRLASLGLDPGASTAGVAIHRVTPTGRSGCKPLTRRALPGSRWTRIRLTFVCHIHIFSLYVWGIRAFAGENSTRVVISLLECTFQSQCVVYYRRRISSVTVHGKLRPPRSLCTESHPVIIRLKTF